MRNLLAFDLANLGYEAIDIGHLNLGYIWFLHKYVKTTKIEKIYFNISNNTSYTPIDKNDPEYAQIIKVVI
jgi:hypothetical protein